MAIASLIGTGGVVLFSILLGKKNKEKANKVFNTSFILIILTSLILTIVFLIFLTPILQFLGTNSQLFKYAKDYIQIIIIGTIFQSLAIGLNPFIRANGYPKTAMITMSVGAIINIILDYIFIVVLKLGIAYAAGATVIGQLCSATIIIFNLFLQKENCKIKIFKTKLDFNIIKLIFEYGMASFVVQAGGMVLNIVLNKSLIKYGGNRAVSSMGIINSIATMVILPVLGIMQGTQPIISYNYGAKKIKRAWNTLKISSIIATIAMIICYGLTLLYAKQIIGMFTKEIQLIDFTKKALTIWFLALPVVGYQIIGSSYFQAIGKYKVSTLLHLSRQILILLPLMIILGQIFGIEGVLYSSPISDVIATIIIFFVLNIEYKKALKQTNFLE